MVLSLAPDAAAGLRRTSDIVPIVSLVPVARYTTALHAAMKL
jgi:hypothetical protein